ncbi:MAG: hypothetical protein R8N23_10565 [Reichenbachiella sp.]|uniref:hypothetical protein n=1 Tax=Reichenbachiella sp. TaxID=2184521 RepID=UPI0029671455|nr:hypothetical protein [Reichenbachiella sp.]MDW3210301.1 hypothetical protein [Reichenbachiella sp.]
MPRKPALSDIDFNENPDAYKVLLDENKRTGIGAVGLAKIDFLPQSLNHSRIHNILMGQVKHPSKEEYDALIKAYSLFPTLQRIKLTPQKINKMKSLIEEKGIKKADISKATPRYYGFNIQILKNWLSGETETADKNSFDAVLSFIEAYEPPKKVQISDRRKSPRLVEITPEYLEKLEAEIKRTNFEPYVLLKRFRIDHIKAVMIHDWRGGRRKKVRPENLSTILDAYATLPDAGLLS